MLFNSQLETFVVVADEGSFSKAAEKLFISTTAVIKQINTLEEDTNIQLFQRSFKVFSLPEAVTSFFLHQKFIINYFPTPLTEQKLLLLAIIL